jgi:predicted nucleic-acid-binding Zn-ribbon protein
VARKPNSSSGIISSGEKANITGNQLEQFVERILKQKGYTEFWDHKTTAFANRMAIGGRQYIKQLPCGLTIYDSPRKVDFFIINRDLFPEDLIIECKWQQVSGSVDEKYPFLLFNILKTGVPTVILLDGSGYKKAAMKWLKDQVHEKSALIGVWNMAEFQTKVNNGFLG